MSQINDRSKPSGNIDLSGSPWGRLMGMRWKQGVDMQGLLCLYRARVSLALSRGRVLKLAPAEMAWRKP